MAKRISSLSVVLGGTVQPFTNAFAGAGKVLDGFKSKVTSVGSSIVSFTGIAAGIGAAFAALKGAASGITLAAELEQTSVAFETMLGSADAARAMMASLTTFAASTPFEFPEIAASAKQLLAFGVAAGDINGKLSMLGDISAGVGKPLGDLALIYGKIKSRGQLTGETLNQLAESGVPIYKALAAQMHVTTSEVAGLVTAGKIGFPEVDAALGSLTATGGQFSGLMKKQSTTLAGLWSTLTDNIGLATAGLVTTVVDAFGLRDALAAFTTFVGNAGTTMNAFVARVAPVVVGWASSLWSTITGIGNAVYAYVAPLLASVYGVFASRWQGILATTVGYAMSLYDVVRAALTAAWTIVGAVWTGIVGVWQWACDLIGYQTTDTGTTVGNAFSTIVDAGQWLQSTLTQVFTVAAYAINNFTTIVEYAGTGIAYQLVSLYNAAAYYFGAGIEYVKWFGTNLTTILFDAFTNALTFSKTFGGNLVNIIKNLPGLIAGTTDWSDVWTPLDDGFASHVSELPTIAARVPGELEQALADQSQGLGDSLVDGMIGSLNDADKRAAAATKGITSAVGNVIGKFEVPPLAAPTFGSGIVTGAGAATDAMEGLDEQSKKTAKAIQNVDNIGFGSAEQMKRIATAQNEFAATKGTTPVTTATPTSPAAMAPAATKGFETPAWFGGMRAAPTTGSPNGFQTPDWFKTPPAAVPAAMSVAAPPAAVVAAPVPRAAVEAARDKPTREANEKSRAVDGPALMTLLVTMKQILIDKGLIAIEEVG